MSEGDDNSLKMQTSERLLSEDFVDESHMVAFAHALRLDVNYFDNHGSASSTHSPASPALHGSRIRKVSALSDFAPVNLKVTRQKKRTKTYNRQDYSFILFRWPLLFFIFAFIMAEFSLYVFIRQLVNAKEWFLAWRGEKGRLRKRLRAARTYEEWKAAAAVLDKFLEFDDWKKVEEDPFYDWMLIRKVKQSLKNFREKNDVRGCLEVLETCTRANFAAVESSRLYSETFYGTKDLIESYIDELERCLVYIRESSDLTPDEKRRFFRSANTNLGVSALCLSGGASFGNYHFGVVKAFYDAGLLPRVITGTSAGGPLATLLCTRTDEELKYLLVPELANRMTASEEPFNLWIRRFWKTGARYDGVDWARKATFFTRGSMTFREAYLRTGRILNISVIPADVHSPTRVLNYITSPDTVIWSAMLASAAVPGLLNPVVLMQKLKDGNLVPWSWGSRFKDGSFRVDIPVQALNLYFNVTYPVVSQVNPHVHLFFFAPQGSAGKPVAHRKGKGWRGNFLLSAAEQWLKHELTKNFRVIRDLELLPQITGQDWSSVFLQRFDGSVTIWPKTRFQDWFQLLTDPDVEEFKRTCRVGESVTWPKLHMIENRLKIERQILLGRQAVRQSYRGRTPTLAKKTAQSQHDQSEATPLATTSSKVPDFEVPLSADTDAEVAFSRRPSFKRRRSSKHLSSSHAEVPIAVDPSYRNRFPTAREETKLQNSLSLGPNTNTSPGIFFSKLRANSLSRLTLPFSYSPRAVVNESSGNQFSNSYSSSSESSTENHTILGADDVE